MDLPNTFVFKSSSSKGKHDQFPCVAEIVNDNQIGISFNIARKTPNQDHYLEIDMGDLRTILLEYARIVPGAALLFADCVKVAAVADSNRIAGQ